MPKTWAFKVRSTVGGTAKGHAFTNTFHVQTDDALDTPAMSAHALAIANCLRGAFLQIVTIQSVTISDPARAGQGYDPAQVRTVPIGLQGQKIMGAEQPEVKTIVVKIRSAGTTGRPGTLSVRMVAYDTEVNGAGDGEANAVGGIGGAAGIADALNGQLAAGINFRMWSKLKSGAISDRAVSAFSYGGVGHRDAHIKRHGKRASTKAPAWMKKAIDVAKQVIDLAGAYQIAKVGTAALEAPAVSAAITAAGEAAGELLPLLALL